MLKFQFFPLFNENSKQMIFKNPLNESNKRIKPKNVNLKRIFIFYYF